MCGVPTALAGAPHGSSARPSVRGREGLTAGEGGARGGEERGEGVDVAYGPHPMSRCLDAGAACATAGWSQD